MRRSIYARVGVLVAAVALVAAACQRGGDQATQEDDGQDTQGQAQQESLLDQIRNNGTLRCGVNNTVPGFGYEVEGELEGFDIDFCKAFAAAIFNTDQPDDSIELTPIDAEERFNALRAGEYDVLVRNTTWTSSRDGTEGVAFAHVNFYDGQAMMVPADSEWQEVADMDGANVCVTTGTTTELNLADYAAQVGIEVTPVTFEENPQLQRAFISGRCDAWTSDRSQLAGIKSQWPQNQGGPDALRILDDVMSKEPLAPAVIDGQDDLHEVVDWVVNGVILAEELGVTSENVDQQAQNPDNPQIAGLLGVSFEAETETISVDHGLAVDNDFMQSVLRAVGNYGEIFDRHLGEGTDIGLERGDNALWTEGGVQYGMPFR